jgi:hypothetical protein
MKFACPWEEIAAFGDPAEFRSFERWMTGQVSAGMARQVPVALPYDAVPDHALLVEAWYLHLKSREVWRLVWPEPPFCGLFIRVLDA